MGMNEENSRASIRAREAEKSHSIRTFLQARGAKKKGPNCIQIRVLLWCRKWDSALRVRSACAPRSACAAAALPGPYKSPTGAFAIRGFESLIAKQKPPRWGGLCFGAPRQSKFEPVSLFARAVVASSKVMVFVPSL